MNTPALQSSSLEKLSATMLASLNTASTTWSNFSGSSPLGLAHLQALSVLSQDVSSAAPHQLNSISQLNSLYLGNLTAHTLPSDSHTRTTLSSLLDTFAELSRTLNMSASSLKASDTNLPLNTVLPLSALRAELPALAIVDTIGAAPSHGVLQGAATAQEPQMLHEGVVPVLAQAPNQSTARQEVRPQELHSTHHPEEPEQELQEEKSSEKPKKQRSSKLLSSLRQLLRTLREYFQEK